ncbi:hypothetical protein NC652_018259 [Populus alba x Populus x berolinensis]|nr:hypothetical protein NC652_018259 [Populus alba x Populus x berolinensis]
MRLQGMLGKDILSLHILHHGLLHLEPQKLFLLVHLLKVILLLDLLRKPQVQHLLQSLNMMDELPFLHGTHQASNHHGKFSSRGHSIPGRAPRVDGKEFFRQARSRLSYEQFSAFLANIKKLNGQEQTREETLRKAEEIFGTDNKDLYFSFRGLLNRNIHLASSCQVASKVLDRNQPCFVGRASESFPSSMRIALA